MSYPCRTVAMTLKALKLDYDIETVDLFKGEQKSPEYLAINPRGKIPTLKDGDYVICERYNFYISQICQWFSTFFQSDPN